jgi:hypothetical protein
MQPLLILPLQPNKRTRLPPLDYDGLLLLRWQIQILDRGVDSSQLQASIEAEQIIPIVGFLSRGQWPIPGGDQLIAPLAEIPYSPLLEWFIVTPSGFRNSQILMYPHEQPIYQSPTAGLTMGFTPPPPNSEFSEKDTVTTIPAVANQQILVSAPNSVRLNGFVVNNTNKTIWLSFGASTVAAAPPAIPVAANGGNADIEQGYEGVIVAFIAPIAANSAALTGTIILHEFNAA